MGFVLSGSVVTQSGTDVDLSGLAAIAGVTVTTLSGDADVAFYELGSLRLEIEGSLTVDSWHEKILLGAAALDPSVQVASGGELVVTGSGEFCIDTAEGSDFGDTNSSIRVVNGGSLTMSDCIVSSARNTTMKTANTGQVRVNGTTFRKITADATQIVRFDFSGTPDAIVDVVLDGVGGLMTGLGTFTGIALKNGGSIDSNHTLQSAGQSEHGIGNSDALFSNISFAGNVGAYSLKVRNDNTMTVRNFDVPIDQIGVTGRLGLGGANQGAVFYERNLAFQIVDGAGAIEAAKVYMAGSPEATATFPTPAVYEYTTAADGSTVTRNILLGVVNALTAASQAEYEAHESYGDGNDMDVRMTARIASYPHNLATDVVPLIGMNDLVRSPAPLGADPNLTEADKATVDTYTDIDTAAKLYDRAKAFLVDNWGTHLDLIVPTNTGDIGGHDLFIDATAAQPFAFDGTTITIRATNFAGTITTTGAVTLANGATANGIIDSTGDSFVTFTAVDTWQLYPTAADRDANTNQTATGTATDAHRFTYTGADTFYLRLTKGTETLFRTLTPAAAGETILSLSIEALLETLPAAPAATTIAAAVWDTDTSSHTAADSFGANAQAPGGVQQADIDAITAAVGSDITDAVAPLATSAELPAEAPTIAEIRDELERAGGAIDDLQPTSSRNERLTRGSYHVT